MQPAVYDRQPSTSPASSDTASSPERKKQKLDPFADLREYTAPSTSASYDRAKIQAELAEYKSLTVPVPAVDHLTFWKQKAQQFPIISLTAVFRPAQLSQRGISPL